MRESVLGIDLGGTKMLLVADHAVERIDTGPAFAPADLVRHVESFGRRHALAFARIGLAVPGLVDGGGTVVACDVLPAFTGWRAPRALARPGVKLVVVNDVEAALIEEFHDAPAGITGGVVLVGTAIGARFLAEGARLRGASGWAGELGYLPVIRDGRVTRLDLLAGGAAIARRCGLSPAGLAERARAGDPRVLDEVAAAGRAFGLGLAAVVNLLSPSRLALGGGTAALPGYLEHALDSARASAVAPLWAVCEITPVRAGPQVVARGAIRAAVFA